MDIATIPLFELADRKLAWIDRRQTLLAANVANVDTPKYRAQDLPAFADAVGRASLAMSATSPSHLAGVVSRGAARPGARDERGPDGNSVKLDEQITKLADTDDAHALVSGLYRGWLGMFRTALGR